MNSPPRGWNERGRRLALADRAVMVIATAGSLAPSIAGDATERGARVALVSHDVRGMAVDRAASIASDLDSESEVDRVYDLAVERLARLDVVVVVLKAHALVDLHVLPPERWRTHIADPLRQAFWLARRALDEFVGSANGGRLIFVIEAADAAVMGDSTSVIGEAIASLARSVAREYGRWAVSCQVVVQAGQIGGASSACDSLRPVVEWVLFLASPAASFVTGETIIVGSPVAPSRHSTRMP